MAENSEQRGKWASGFGFVMAAAGSAIGLGNLWRFPYITGENGGGLFVLIYLGFIALVGLPILMAEIALGRASGSSTVTAFRRLAGPRSWWAGVGWLGLVTCILVLSGYAVVAGWALHYTFLAATGGFSGLSPDEIGATFGALFASGRLNLLWSVVFMAMTVALVAGGVRRGIERGTKILMPALFVMLLILLGKSLTLDGFGEAFNFVFGFHADRLTPAGVLEALGHAFFTLGVGVGVMLTYGSYVGRDADIGKGALVICGLDTLIALLACLVIFPITFSYGLDAGDGPGLVFTTLPVAFGQMPAGNLLATVFFALLVFAALTSAISLLEVPTAFLIDERGWSRKRATLAAGGFVTLLAIPCALAGALPIFGEGLKALVGKDWLDLVFDTTSNLMLPAGGLGFAVYTAWRFNDLKRREQFAVGLGRRMYVSWLQVLRWLVPIAVLVVVLNALGVF